MSRTLLALTYLSLELLVLLSQLIHFILKTSIHFFKITDPGHPTLRDSLQLRFIHLKRKKGMNQLQGCQNGYTKGKRNRVCPLISLCSKNFKTFFDKFPASPTFSLSSALLVMTLLPSSPCLHWSVNVVVTLFITLQLPPFIHSLIHSSNRMKVRLRLLCEYKVKKCVDCVVVVKKRASFIVCVGFKFHR